MALSFLMGVADALADADALFHKQEWTDYEPILLILSEAPSLADMVSWIKYFTCWPMARWLRQEDMPDCPAGLEGAVAKRFPGGFMFPLAGGHRRALKNLVAARTSNVRSAKVCWALLQGVKRGCDCVPDTFVERTLQKHADALQKVLPDLTEDNQVAVRRKFRDLWHVPRRRGPYIAYPPREVRRPRANAGFNACYEKTRSSGGKSQAVREAVMALVLERHGHEAFEVGDEVYQLEETVDRRDWILPELHPDLISWMGAEAIRNDPGIMKAAVATVLEPLKCRTITKGPAIPYWASMTAQRMMWDRLQEFEQFSLTGRPLDQLDLHWIYDKTERLLAGSGVEFDQWVSGDYSAATDGLSQEVNQLCLEQFMHAAGATEDERLVWTSVLGNHRIEYPTKRYPGAPEPFMQSCGQLMGCPLSFPILCAINVVGYWLALEEFLGRPVALRDLPVKVNGDDILFQANDAFYAVWKEWVARVGFTLSPGKNYLARHFLTVNSEGFLFSVQDGRPTFRKVGYLNTGLLYSSKADRRARGARGQRKEVNEMPWIDKINACVRTSNNPARTLAKALSHYKEEIVDATKNGLFNALAAPELGGLGIVRPTDFTTVYTPFQMTLAGVRLREFKDRHETEQNLFKCAPYSSSLEMVKTLDGVWELVAPEASGQVVLRERTEPLRRGELRLPNAANGPLNYRISHEREQPQLRWNLPTKREVVRTWESIGSVGWCHDPSGFFHEFRVMLEDREEEEEPDDGDLAPDLISRLFNHVDGINFVRLTSQPAVWVG